MQKYDNYFKCGTNNGKNIYIFYDFLKAFVNVDFSPNKMSHYQANAYLIMAHFQILHNI